MFSRSRSLSPVIPLLEQGKDYRSERLRQATCVQPEAHSVQVGLTGLFTSKIATVYGS